ncbi:hypothetical protein AB0C12_24285 [Actinoplanes sp. NPDC048967]|uniref:hypothetical protein n=1 Tax=Actinoplanes sp. NPDC048967 TaxID=3155269 RepID=UPI0033F38812
MNQYFAVTDDRHDAKDPVTVVRVVEGAGPYGITRLNDDAAWVRTTLLDQIESGEVPYRLRSVSRKAAARIRERREKKIAFRYSILVRDDDPSDEPIGVLREWDAASGDSSYAETFTRDGEWEHTTVRLDIERGSDIRNRIVPSDAATVHRFIESLPVR